MVNLGEPRAITAAISPSAADIDRTSINNPSTSRQQRVSILRRFRGLHFRLRNAPYNGGEAKDMKETRGAWGATTKEAT